MSDSASGTCLLAPPCAAHVREPGSVDLNEVPDGLIVYDARHGQVHYLNPTATAVYLLCTGESGPESIAAEIQVLWGLAEAPDRIVRECIADLVARRLVGC